jgi:tRNA U34 5-carboxymethylaminomethyl modifying GTPase MnmE/TrmE
VSGHGIADLKSHIFSHLEGVSPAQLNAMNQRHRQLSSEAAAALTDAAKLCKDDPEANAALIASHLRTAAMAVGQIIGTEYHNDLLDNIFQKFCIGK